MSREKRIYRVTLAGSSINALLLVLKFIAGILGNSAAMIASAVHSLSDFATDIIVLLFVRLSTKPEDKRHNYGYGKYETLATTIIGALVLFAGITVCVNGARDIYETVNGKHTESPGYIALAVAVASIILKEWAFRFMRKAGNEVNSEAIKANAWHHRSDALSAVGTSFGIGGAIFLGSKWAILDPVTAVITSLFIIHAAARLVLRAVNELLEKSLPETTGKEIIEITESEEGIERVEKLYTRNIGSRIAMEIHVRMPGHITIREAERHVENVETKLKDRFGKTTHICICTLSAENAEEKRDA